MTSSFSSLTTLAFSSATEHSFTSLSPSYMSRVSVLPSKSQSESQVSRLPSDSSEHQSEHIFQSIHGDGGSLVTPTRSFMYEETSPSISNQMNRESNSLQKTTTAETMNIVASQLIAVPSSVSYENYFTNLVQSSEMLIESSFTSSSEVYHTLTTYSSQSLPLVELPSSSTLELNTPQASPPSVSLHIQPTSTVNLKSTFLSSSYSPSSVDGSHTMESLGDQASLASSVYPTLSPSLSTLSLSQDKITSCRKYTYSMCRIIVCFNVRSMEHYICWIAFIQLQVFFSMNS